MYLEPDDCGTRVVVMCSAFSSWKHMQRVEDHSTIQALYRCIVFDAVATPSVQTLLMIIFTVEIRAGRLASAHDGPGPDC